MTYDEVEGYLPRMKSGEFPWRMSESLNPGGLVTVNTKCIIMPREQYASGYKNASV